MDEYLKQVEKSYDITKKDVESHEKGDGTSIKDVLQYMIDTREEITWHPSYSFAGNQTSTGGFLSHRACARASDLAIHHKDLVEARPVGKIHVYRLKRENPQAIKQFINI